MTALTAEAGRMAAVARYEILDTPPDGTFDRIAELAARLLGVPIAIVSVVDTDRIWFKAHHGLDVSQIDREPGLCASAIMSYEPWVITDAATDPRALANPLVAGEFGLRFYAGAPLTTPDGWNLGTLCVIDKEPREITVDETTTLQALAQLVIDELELRRRARQAVATAEERLQAMEGLAQALQASLLPPSLPTIAGLDVQARYEPANRHVVGGDFYDVFPMHESTWCFVIGDVMGKGPQAAARTSRARYGIRAAATYEHTPAGVLRAVNHALLADTDGGPDTPFVTALFARARPTDGGGAEVSFASAGHPLPTVLRADGSVETTGSPGMPLGMFDDMTVADSTLQLNPGDLLVMVTDGVHDSGAPPLHQEGVEALLRTSAGRGVDEVVTRLHALATAAQRDDVAILAVAAPWSRNS